MNGRLVLTATSLHTLRHAQDKLREAISLLKLRDCRARWSRARNGEAL